MRKSFAVTIGVGVAMILFEMVFSLAQFFGCVSGRVNGFAATESGYVGIMTSNNLIIVDTSGNDVTVRRVLANCTHIRAEEDSFVLECDNGPTIRAKDDEREGSYAKYSIDGNELENGKALMTRIIQDLSVPIKAGTSTYTCEKRFFGVKIYEQTDDGERELRYNTPSLERAIRFGSLIAGILLGVCFILVWVFVLMDYEVTKDGRWYRKNKSTEATLVDVH